MVYCSPECSGHKCWTTVDEKPCHFCEGEKGGACSVPMKEYIDGYLDVGDAERACTADDFNSPETAASEYSKTFEGNTVNCYACSYISYFICMLGISR